jgi:hypothetical protein
MGNARIMAYCQNNVTGTRIAGTGIPGAGATQLNYPYDIAFDSSWNLYVVDTTNSRLQKFNVL